MLVTIVYAIRRSILFSFDYPWCRVNFIVVLVLANIRQLLWFMYYSFALCLIVAC